jgi:hypothetical protein
LNSGCKNIDGFCTFQHGISELQYNRAWKIPKKLNLDRHVLDCIRKLPLSFLRHCNFDIFGIDSPCLLNYAVAFAAGRKKPAEKEKAGIVRKVKESFNLFQAIDACGACRLRELKEAGVYGVKIVGRNFSTEKKEADVVFVKTIIDKAAHASLSNGEFFDWVRQEFRRTYALDCRNLCYYPDGM